MAGGNFMSVQDRRKYDPDFKRNAVRLTEEPGRTVVDVAEGLGIATDLLYRWKREQRNKEGYAFPGYGRETLTPHEQKIRELEKKLRDTEMERDIFKKAMADLQQGTEMRFQFIHENRSSFTVKKMCHVLKLSLSGYSRWSKAPLSSWQIEKENLKERIREIFAKHNGMVGSPMVTADIHDDPAFSKVSLPRVARLMREMGLKCGTVKKFVVTTDSQHNEPVAPDQIWVSDMTYLKVGSRWYYLTVFPVRRWLGSQRFPRKTFSDPSPESILRHLPSRGLMVHSDRGV
jgi:putative transposase